MYQSIYVPVDNSEHSNACEVLGLELAETFEAKATGSHVYAAQLHDVRFKQMEFTLPEEYKEETELEKQRRIHDALITRGLQLISDSYLDRMETMAAEKGVPFSRLRADGRNFVEIVRELEEGDYDLVVMGALGQGAVTQSTVGSVCERTLRRIEVDTLVVRDPSRAALTDEGPIVVAMDGSARSWGALRAACALAQSGRRMVEVVCVQAIGGAGEALLDAHLRLARTVLREQGLRVRATVLDGNATTALVEHLQSVQPWLVVVGRTGIDTEDGQSGIGSTAEHLVARAPCNVLVVSQSWTATEASDSMAA